MERRKYYEAYDDRYRQVHQQNLQWFAVSPSPIVEEVLNRYNISAACPILEIGCGEGRDAWYLLKQGYHLLATDISQEAIAFCRNAYPDDMERFQTLDCVKDTLDKSFGFIYAVAVLHMLTEREDRDAFYRFFRQHLSEDGIGLICSMGDGTTERCTDPATAFTLQTRIHEPTGSTVCIAGTSLRMVSFPKLLQEIGDNGLAVCEYGLTKIEPDYGDVMYAVVKRKS